MEKIALTALQACDALLKSIPAGDASLAATRSHLALLIPELRQLLIRSCDATHKAWELQGKRESCLCARCDFESGDWSLVFWSEITAEVTEVAEVESEELETCRRDDAGCLHCGS